MASKSKLSRDAALLRRWRLSAIAISDVRSSGFTAAARQQSRVVAASPQARSDQAFIDAITGGDGL